MGKKNGPWTINDSVCRFKSPLIELYEDKVMRPDGQPAQYVTVRVKAGVTVLALDDEGCVHLAKEFRYAVGRECVEAVGGAVDEGEEPVEAARRELREELGIEAEELIPMGRVEPMTSIVVAPSHQFLARRLQFREPQPQGPEDIQRIKMPLEDAVRMVMAGEITDPSSCALILKAHEFVKE
jgi:ADP-ribose pyrophosphatase